MPLEHISEVKLFKKGHEGINVYTLHYCLKVELQRECLLKVLETNSESKIRRQCCLIKNFLGMGCSEADIRIIDETN